MVDARDGSQEMIVLANFLGVGGRENNILEAIEFTKGNGQEG